MTLIGLGVIVMALSMVAVAVALVPTLAEIRRTVVATRETLARTEAEMKPMIAELRETLADIKVLTATAAEGQGNIKELLEAAGETSQGLRTIGSAVNGVSCMLTSSSLWLTGAKVAGKFILDRVKNRRAHSTGGNEHGK